MPPKPKFTREEVLAAALQIVREQGHEALTARNLGAALNSSTRPLFTLFTGMEDIKNQLFEGPAMQIFYDYHSSFREYTPAFKRFGLMLVSFAEEEPHLFSFLFMCKHGNPRSVIEWADTQIGSEAQAVLMRDYDLSPEVAQVLFTEEWLHTFSLCVLKVSGVVDLSAEEVSNSLSRSFIGLLSLAKAGRLLELGVNPMAITDEQKFDIKQAPTVDIVVE